MHDPTIIPIVVRARRTALLQYLHLQFRQVRRVDVDHVLGLVLVIRILIDAELFLKQEARLPRLTGWFRNWYWRRCRNTASTASHIVHTSIYYQTDIVPFPRILNNRCVQTVRGLLIQREIVRDR